MGIDLQSLALPLDADPVRAIRADPGLWETASEQPPFAGPWGDEPLPDVSRALLAALPPGTAWVSHFGDRSFQQAAYLLGATGDRIVLGDEPFAEHATSGQGFRWRCSTAAFLTEAVARIDAFDAAAARARFSVAEMDALGLYKVHADEDDDAAFARVLAQLRAYAEHCRAVAARGLDLIITLY